MDPFLFVLGAIVAIGFVVATRQFVNHDETWAVDQQSRDDWEFGNDQKQALNDALAPKDTTPIEAMRLPGRTE